MKHCPKCGKTQDRMCRTLIGFIGDGPDPNKNICVCGWMGKDYQLVDCPHLHFRANVIVNRLEEYADESRRGELSTVEAHNRFCADVTIKCDDCATPFRFIGLPAGLDLNGACTNPDATEGRFAIGPKDEVRLLVQGFSVRRDADKKTRLHELLQKVLMPKYPTLGSMGGGSSMEQKLQEKWEAEYGSPDDPGYRLQCEIRQLAEEL